MADVFISYKRADRSYAKRIAKLLTERGYVVWWDVELLPGDRFADEINEILNSVRAAIILWTPESVQSDWVKSEANIALNRNILIPVLLRETSIPAPYNLLHSLNLTSWNDSSSDIDLDIVIKAIEKKIGASTRTAKQLTPKEINTALEKPHNEVILWASISNSLSPSIGEYQLYIDTYGENGSFTKLAHVRINELKKNIKPKYSVKEVLTLVSIAMGILVGGFTIATSIGNLKTNGQVINPATNEHMVAPDKAAPGEYNGAVSISISTPKLGNDIYIPDSSGDTAEPERIILEKYPLVVFKTISTWNGGSHEEQCVPALLEKPGYVLVNGRLYPGFQYPEGVRAGCPPPGDCDGPNEYCTTIQRPPACYVNKAWYDWKAEKLIKAGENLSYKNFCE